MEIRKLKDKVILSEREIEELKLSVVQQQLSSVTESEETGEIEVEDFLVEDDDLEIGSNDDHSKCVGVCTCRRQEEPSSEEEENGLKCEKCDFVASSEMGLSIHKGKMHKKKTKVKKKNRN